MLSRVLEAMLLHQAATHPTDTQIAEWLSYDRSHVDYARGKGRRVASLLEWAPLRIHVDTQQLRKDWRNSDHSAALRYVEDDVIPAAVRWFSRTLRVHPVQGRLQFKQWCSSTWEDGTCKYIHSSSGMCGPTSIPEDHLKELEWCPQSRSECSGSPGGDGVKDVDFILYVSADPSVCRSHPEFQAMAAVCRQDDNDRPIAGFMVICKLIDNWSEDMSLLIHETLHALGFSRLVFPFFRHDDGTPRTPRTENGFPPKERGRYVAGNSTLSKVVLEDGTTKHYMVLPRVLQAARDYYGCADLDKFPMEEIGGDGAALSHWDARAMHSEIMTHALTLFPLVSKMTLALLEDSGWYKPEYANVGGFSFGRNKGCRFLTEACVKNDMSQFPDTFCTIGPESKCGEVSASSLGTGCTHDLMGKAYCDKCNHEMALPSRFQYFRDRPTLGGSSAYLGFCPTWMAYLVMYGRVTSFCMDMLYDTKESEALGESFGATSRCIMSTASSSNDQSAALGGTCHRTRCNDAGLEIQVGDKWIFCSAGDKGNKILLGHNWSGYVVCPSHKAICDGRIGHHSGVEVTCAFPSTPRHGRCVCAPGYLGKSCTVEETMDNRAIFPYGLQYHFDEVQLEVNKSVDQDLQQSLPRIQGNLNNLNYTVDPPLPLGLCISSTNGTLRGAARAPSSRASYTVTAKGDHGATAATWFIAVACPPEDPKCERHVDCNETALLNGCTICVRTVADSFSSEAPKHSKGQVNEDSDMLLVVMVATISIMVSSLLVVLAVAVCFWLRKSGRESGSSPNAASTQKRDPGNPSDPRIVEPDPVGKKAIPPPSNKWEALQQMLKMGFNFDRAREALEENAWDVDRAAASLSP